jgi:sugar phosphate isomerase/epimerase
MKLILSRSTWGIEQPWEIAVPLLKQQGFRAVESSATGDDRARLRKLLDQHGMDYIAMVFSRGATIEEHVASLRTQVEEAKAMRPLFINAHSGLDRWSLDESKKFFEGALRVEAESGLRWAHETHRGRILYNPWITRDLVTTFKDLKLTFDLSHWVCVCERLIDSEIDIIKQCAERVMHIHARVGYEEGPQVPDPRAPEYQDHLTAHERWWDIVWDTQERMGTPAISLTPEFGPPGYMHTLPYSNVPVANLWDICTWQGQRQAERFSRRTQRITAKS